VEIIEEAGLEMITEVEEIIMMEITMEMTIMIIINETISLFDLFLLLVSLL